MLSDKRVQEARTYSSTYVRGEIDDQTENFMFYKSSEQDDQI